MKFCEVCGNILLPRKVDGKHVLYCKVCDKEYPVEKEEDLKEYKRSTKMRSLASRRKKMEANKTIIIEENIKQKSISEDERKAMEDLFEAPE